MKYSELVEVYEQLAGTSKRLEKSAILAPFLVRLQAEQPRFVYLLRGRVVPRYDSREFGISGQLVIKAIGLSYGVSEEEVMAEVRRVGDFGEIAAAFSASRRQGTLFSEELTVERVVSVLQQVMELEGKGAVGRKLVLVKELLVGASGDEAKYLVRTLLGDLRIGVQDGVLRDAIAEAYFGKKGNGKNPSPAAQLSVGAGKAGGNKPERADRNGVDGARVSDEGEDGDGGVGEVGKGGDGGKKVKKKDEGPNVPAEAVVVQKAFDLTNDWARVLQAAARGEKQLKKLGLTPGKPVQVMLPTKVASMEEAFAVCAGEDGRVALEHKYDGFRVMVHREGDRVWLFTRRLEDVTKQFPDVVDAVRTQVKGERYILDTEVVGYDRNTRRYQPFESISQRIKRKYDIPELVEKLPVEVNVFDVLSLGGKKTMDLPFIERRAMLEKMVKIKEWVIRLAEQLVTDDLKKAEEFYQEALRLGEEGVMVKSLGSGYQQGRRVGYMVKLKPVLEDLDLVVVGAEWGTGKRAGWLTSYIVACSDGGDLMEVGKVASGLKELENEEGAMTYEEMTALLRPLILSEEGKVVSVEPKVVLSVTYQNIQGSPAYSSGLALRFPRVTAYRPDKSVSEIATLGEVEKEAKKQER